MNIRGYGKSLTVSGVADFGWAAGTNMYWSG
jgi:hypothetical protein